ncbi:MAG: response regulator transcription factor [Synechococcaceae cyanobacterium]|nr:response regulator transcription factor [Synechococcaceae cyanobacterium]
MDCLILEDQVLLADLLVRDLEGLPGISHTAVAHSVAEGLRLCRERPPDLLLLDLGMPDGDGAEVAEALLRVKPQARVIVLSAQCDGFSCSPLLHDAVVAVVDKSQAIDTLHELILPLLRQAAGAALPADPRRRLTERERQVFDLIGRGLSSEEIAAALRISLLTARTHRRNITAKLGVKGAELVLLASAAARPVP